MPQATLRNYVISSSADEGADYLSAVVFVVISLEHVMAADGCKDG
jgi:hypothetical protein